MKYFEVVFQITPWQETAADILSALCGDLGFETFITEEPFLKGYIQQENYDEAAITNLLQFFPIENSAITFKCSEAEYKNWNEEWEKNGFDPIEIGTELLVQGINHQCQTNHRYQIILNPQMAFGTGSHETTYMILEQLLMSDLKNKAVLDAGCGTGVLGIMAALKEAGPVLAYDIDEWSVRNTETNCALNNVDSIEIKKGDSSVISQMHERFDFVLANINRNILLADMQRFAQALKANGTLILSGFYKEDATVLLQEATRLNLTLTQQKNRNEWCCLILTKI